MRDREKLLWKCTHGGTFVSSYAEKQILLAVHRKQSEKGIGAAAGDYSQCGPPNWDRGQWEAFKNQYGRYPYGHDGQGGFEQPPTYDDAPSWVFDLMGIREPPIRTRRP